MKETFTTITGLYDLDGKLLKKPYIHQELDHIEFSDDEKEHINNILGNCDKKKVNEFIKKIEPICGLKFESEKCYKSTQKDANENRLSLIKKIESMNRELDSIVLEEKEIVSYTNMRGPGTDGEILLLEEETLLACDFASQILLDLSNKLDRLNSLLSQPGRLTANSDGFYSDLAELYATYIDVPTTTRKGTFNELVGVINQAIGLPGDPERAIRQAVKEIKKR